MYAAMTKDEGNEADGCFSAAYLTDDWRPVNFGFDQRTAC